MPLFLKGGPHRKVWPAGDLNDSMTPRPSLPLFLSRLVVLYCAWSVGTGLLLSGFKVLDATGVTVSFFGFVCTGLALWLASPPLLRFRPGRYHRILPAAFLLILCLSFLGGILHPPNNYDFLTYRYPRLLHWIAGHSWHWTGSFNRRMDLSGTGSEWGMLPLWVIGRGDRLFFLPNILMYACLPALTFLTVQGLGIPCKAGWVVAWLVPGLAGAVMQAASVGNDLPGLFFFLAAMAFSLRSVQTKSWLDFTMALVAAALLTSVKASNIPLVLPVAIVLCRLLPWLISRPLRLAAVAGIVIFSVPLSFVPAGVSNHVHTGSWNGDPLNLGRYQIESPIFGIIGNSLQLLVNSLNPPVFPAAGHWNSSVIDQLCTDASSPISRLREKFPRLALHASEIPNEEGAGMGLGIALVLLVTFLATICSFRKKNLGRGRSSFQKIDRWSLVTLAGGILAAGVFFAKFGNDSGPRLLLPYYPVLLLSFFSVHRMARVASRPWARAFYGLAVLTILPSVLLTPSRPLVSPPILVSIAKYFHVSQPFVERIKTVYSVYEDRNDALAVVRNNFPVAARVIGFAGTSDDSELSFWRPFGQRQVIDLIPVNGHVPSISGLDCIVGSERGIHDRFGLSSQDFAKVTNGQVIWSAEVPTRAGSAPIEWFVIIPGGMQGPPTLNTH